MPRWRARWPLCGPAQAISPSPGLHDVAKALVASYLKRELRRPAFFVTDFQSSREALSRKHCDFSAAFFPGTPGGVATLRPSTGFPGNRKARTRIFSNGARLRSFASRMGRFPW